MKPLLPGYKEVRERRYWEIAGLMILSQAMRSNIAPAAPFLTWTTPGSHYEEARQFTNQLLIVLLVNLVNISPISQIRKNLSCRISK